MCSIRIPLRILVPPSVVDHLKKDEFYDRFHNHNIFLTDMDNEDIVDSVLFVWGSVRVKKVIADILGQFLSVQGVLRNMQGERATVMLLPQAMKDVENLLVADCTVHVIGTEGPDIVVSVATLGFEALVNGIAHIYEEMQWRCRVGNFDSVYQCIASKNKNDVLSGKYGIIMLGNTPYQPPVVAKREDSSSRMRYRGNHEHPSVDTVSRSSTHTTPTDSGITKSGSIPKSSSKSPLHEVKEYQETWDNVGWALLKDGCANGLPLSVVTDNLPRPMQITVPQPNEYEPKKTQYLEHMVAQLERQTKTRCQVFYHGELGKYTFKLNDTPMKNALAYLFIQNILNDLGRI